MVNNLTVAWATPVNVYDLGARLEAYVEGKATISTFRSCIGNAHTDAPLTKLPPELVEIVADYVRRPILERRQKTWEASRCCCQRMCFPTDHLTDAQISNYKVDLFGEDCELFDDRILDFEDELRANGIGEAEHDLKIDDFLEKIDECLPYTKSTSPFQRCKHIFKQDFNLEIYFSTFHDFASDDFHNPERNAKVHVLAYLILPSVQSAIKSSPGPFVVSTLSSMIIDPSILQIPAAEVKARFKRAMSTLHLRPHVRAVQVTTSSPTSTRPETPQWRRVEEDPFSNKPTDCEEEARALEKTEWPKLMVLSSSHFAAEEYDY